jgi:hypothetical protein
MVCRFLWNYTILNAPCFLTILETDLPFNNIFVCRKFPDYNTVVIIVFHILFADSMNVHLEHSSVVYVLYL